MTGKPDGKWWRPKRAILNVVALLAFYVLSVGPAITLVGDSGYFDYDPRHPVGYVATIFYTPLGAASRTFPPLDSFLEWWVDLWNPGTRRTPDVLRTR